MKVQVKGPSAREFGAVQALAPQLTRAHIQGINATAKGAAGALVGHMRRVFRNPVPYTLNALRVEEANAGKLEAGVMIKGKQDAPGAAIPQQSFLRAQILGGARRFKRFELLLWRRGLLERGFYAVPGAGARLDGYGNMSRGQIVELLAYFEAFGTPPSGRAGRRNSTNKSRAAKAKGTRKRVGKVYFVQPVGAKGLKPGIWERQVGGGRFMGPANSRPVMVVAFVKTAAYGKRFNFWEEAERYTAEQLQGHVDASFALHSKRYSGVW